MINDCGHYLRHELARAKLTLIQLKELNDHLGKMICDCQTMIDNVSCKMSECPYLGGCCGNEPTNVEGTDT